MSIFTLSSIFFLYIKSSWLAKFAFLLKQFAHPSHLAFLLRAISTSEYLSSYRKTCLVVPKTSTACFVRQNMQNQGWPEKGATWVECAIFWPEKLMFLI